MLLPKSYWFVQIKDRLYFCIKICQYTFYIVTLFKIGCCDLLIGSIKKDKRLVFFGWLHNVFIIIYKCIRCFVVLSIIQVNKRREKKICPVRLNGFWWVYFTSSSTYSYPEAQGRLKTGGKVIFTQSLRFPEGIFDFIFNIIFRQKLNTVKSQMNSC